MPRHVFTTSDGYKLVKIENGEWTDGDLIFESGPDGMPIESQTREPLEGIYHCEEEP
jgi:hypothetical protein